MERTGAGALFLLAALTSAARATPLHGLGNVFRSQTPEAYRQSVMKTVADAKSGELRSGTLEDLQRKATQNTKAPPATNKPAPATSKPAPASGRSSALSGKATGGKTTSGAVQRDTSPRLIGRPLTAGSTQSFTAEGVKDTQLRIQARELLEVLGYFNAENVNWDGHMGANCDYAGFLKAARETLPEFGAVGVEAVVQAIGEELTGVTIPREVTQNPQGYVSVYNSVYAGAQNDPLTRDRKAVQEGGLANEQIVQRTLLSNPSYHDDLIALLEVFSKRKVLTPEMRQHLKKCAAGQKPAEVKPLAQRVQAILNPAPLSDAGVVELLKALEAAEDIKDAQQLRKRLENASPKYAEVKPHLAEIWTFAGSSNKNVSEAATAQVENAFWRAPIPECLSWLGRGDAQLNKLIWQRLDERIKRAKAEAPARLVEYRDSALDVLKGSDAALPARRAGLDFLAQLKDRSSAAPIVEVLPNLPRELRAPSGETLRSLTSQNFGPREGDGLVEVKVAQQRWQRWLKMQ